MRIVVEAMAKVEPDHALRIARTIEDPVHRVWALSGVAREMVSTNPKRSRQLLLEAMKVALKLKNADKRDLALRPIALAVGNLDKRYAIRIHKQRIQTARSIGNSEERSRTMKFIVSDLAPIDPHMAYTLTEEITEPDERSLALLYVAEAMAVRNVKQVINVARSIANDAIRAVALARVAGRIRAHRGSVDNLSGCKGKVQSRWIFLDLC
ncbi:MAG: hypothetical protein N3B10_03740 [Armatimonadetes bacterium]|nr:hypothetical protein [Armatimonadota bacterium]